MKQNFKRINGVEARNEHLHVEAFEMHHNKKYGALCWDDTMQTAFLMEFDSVEDLSDYYGLKTEDWMGIDEIQVGETITDGVGAIFTRIW